MVHATGVPNFIAEIGEQLAWLGAALNPLRHTPEPSYCTPNIETFPINGTGSAALHCLITFKCENLGKTTNHINGQCWHSMFNGPVIVRGFPITRRTELPLESGLETTLGILVTLLRTRYIDTFNSNIFIKGFSSMLVPTQKYGNALVWHLFVTANPDNHISYLDCTVKHAKIDIAGLEQTRHIIGWLTVTDCVIGKFRCTIIVG